jgi:autotransporter-associated beta strand protein
LQRGTITGGAGVLTASSYSLRSGTVSAIIAGSGTTTVVATNVAADAVVTLTRDNTYSGATTITSGILRLGAAGGATNTPLGTSVGATTVATIGALDLNGFTMISAEAINTLSGLGFGPGASVANGNSNMGALMNTNASPATFNGAITLGAASRIKANAGALTIGGNISGATLGLTIGGFSDSTFSGVIGTTSGTVTKDGFGTDDYVNAGTGSTIAFGSAQARTLSLWVKILGTTSEDNRLISHSPIASRVRSSSR